MVVPWYFNALSKPKSDALIVIPVEPSYDLVPTVNALGFFKDVGIVGIVIDTVLFDTLLTCPYWSTFILGMYKVPDAPEPDIVEVEPEPVKAELGPFLACVAL